MAVNAADRIVDLSSQLSALKRRVAIIEPRLVGMTSKDEQQGIARRIVINGEQSYLGADGSIWLGGSRKDANWDLAFGWGNWASNFGATSGKICQGNDSRLSDARTPTIHYHSALIASDGDPNPALSVDAIGRVGILVASPDTPLHVLGAATIQGAAAGKFKIEVTGNGISSSDLSFIDVYNGSSYMFMDRFKRLGLSTVTPQEKLHVNDGNIFFTSYLTGTGARASSSYIAFKGANDSTLNRKSAMIEIRHNESVNFSTDLHIYTTDNSNNLTANLSVMNTGYVGVGNMTPSSKLDVVGDVEIGTANAFYLGDPTTDGTWRIIRNGSNLEIQVRVSGSYVGKTVIVL